MIRLDRTNTTLMGRWWWTIDRLMFGALILIIGFGAVLVMAASPAVASRIGVHAYYFVNRQMIFLCMSVAVLFIVSLMPPKFIRYGSLIAFAAAIAGLIAVLFIGPEVKGATRWLQIGSFSLQPSEFVKPLFAIIIGWVLAEKHARKNFPGFKVAGILYLMVVLLLVLQPDFGMTVMVTLVWLAQLFLAGLPIFLVLGGIGIALVGVTGAYFTMPHVAGRINRFLDPESGDTYQITKSLQAFASGGVYGRGPGEGVIKESIPDSHTDFIFAVAGEELGLLACLLLVMLFAFVVLRGFTRIASQSDLFVFYATAGLLIQFGLQAIINMGVTLHLFPTKGMTLPFVSYGGSSVLAMGMAMGMVLALTRKRYGVARETWKTA